MNRMRFGLWVARTLWHVQDGVFVVANALGGWLGRRAWAARRWAGQGRP